MKIFLSIRSTDDPLPLGALGLALRASQALQPGAPITRDFAIKVEFQNMPAEKQAGAHSNNSL